MRQFCASIVGFLPHYVEIRQSLERLNSVAEVFENVSNPAPPEDNHEAYSLVLGQISALLAEIIMTVNNRFLLLSLEFDPNLSLNEIRERARALRMEKMINMLQDPAVFIVISEFLPWIDSAASMLVSEAITAVAKDTQAEAR